METCKTVVRKGLLAVCAWLLLSGTGLGLEGADEQQVKTILSRFMDEVRQHYMHSGPVDDIVEKYGPALIPYIDDYSTDPCDKVRWHAYVLVWRIGLDANDLQVRQKIVTGLVRGVRDDAYNSGYLAHWLLRFASTDFSEASRQAVRDVLVRAMAESRAEPREDIILLAGVADLKSELPRLKQFIDEHEGRLKQQHEQNLAEWAQTVEKMPERRQARFADSLLKQYWQNSLVWAALRARARMGVEEDIARCIALVESHADEDYRVAWLLKEVSYVRRPEVVDYLHKYLKSEKVRESKGRDTVVGTYAQHAAKGLAQMLRGFPGRKDIGGDKETIELRRKWMREQKEWDIIR
ncbi:MAG: hypothetical protein ACYST6_05445 [Planctomycetota bacterium]|jgi:hypothetical protein